MQTKTKKFSISLDAFHVSIETMRMATLGNISAMCQTYFLYYHGETSIGRVAKYPTRTTHSVMVREMHLYLLNSQLH